MIELMSGKNIIVYDREKRMIIVRGSDKQDLVAISARDFLVAHSNLVTVLLGTLRYDPIFDSDDEHRRRLWETQGADVVPEGQLGLVETRQE